MKLTKRQREILERMKRAQDDPLAEEADLVEEGLQVWCGLQKTNHATLWFFLKNCLVSASDSGGCGSKYYHINQWGRLALKDPDFNPQALLSKTILTAEKAGLEVE